MGGACETGLRDAQKLYLMKNEFGLTKIGISKHPSKRAAELENASGVAVELVASWETARPAIEVEQSLHRIFSDRRKSGEWFDGVSPDCVEKRLSDLDTPVARLSQGGMNVGRGRQKNWDRAKRIKIVESRPVNPCIQAVFMDLHGLMMAAPSSLSELSYIQDRQRACFEILTGMCNSRVERGGANDFTKIDISRLLTMAMDGAFEVRSPGSYGPVQQEFEKHIDGMTAQYLARGVYNMESTWSGVFYGEASAIKAALILQNDLIGRTQINIDNLKYRLSDIDEQG